MAWCELFIATSYNEHLRLKHKPIPLPLKKDISDNIEKAIKLLE